MKKFSRIIQGLAVVVGLLVLATSGQAATVTDVTQGFGTYSWTTGADSISITLTDIAINPTSVIQNISGFTFGAAGGGNGAFQVWLTPTSAGGTLLHSAPIQSGCHCRYNGAFLVAAPCTYWLEPVAAGPTRLHDHWHVSNNGYADANGSLMDNDPHNPFILHTATFILGIDGITSDTVLTGATIMFGTEWTATPPHRSRKRAP